MNAARIPHGTTHAYSNLKCRCDECRQANRDKSARRRQRRFGTEPAHHGLLASYTDYKCRCAPCRAAAAEWRRLYRLNRTGQ